MTYVYREASRMARCPVHVPEDVPETPPAVVHSAETTPPRPALPKAYRPLAKRNPRPMPPPIWGGTLGLKLATHEAIDWERRHPRHNYFKDRTQT